jgi:hypothetical protein
LDSGILSEIPLLANDYADKVGLLERIRARTELRDSGILSNYPKKFIENPLDKNIFVKQAQQANVTNYNLWLAANGISKNTNYPKDMMSHTARENDYLTRIEEGTSSN